MSPASTRPVAQWSSGPHHAVAWDCGLALVSGDLPLAVANQLWARLVGVDDLRGFVTALSDVADTDLATLPDFAVGVIREDDLHLAARGRLIALADVSGHGVAVDGSTVETWTERQVVGATSVSLHSLDGDRETAGLRFVASGVVPAGLLRATLLAGPVTVPIGRVSLPGPAPTGKADAAAPAAPPSVEAGRRVKAATLFPEDDIDPATPVVPPEATPGSPPAPPVPPDPPEPAARASGSRSPLSPPSMRGPMWGAPPSVPAPGTDGVLAVLCPVGHANPPQRRHCRSCGDALDGPPQQVVRPSLGRLLTSAGAIELTAPVVIGRAPRAARFQGSETPHLLVLTEAHISATHLGLRIDGWSVLAEDLGSTNGTYVRRHGQQPFRLVGQPHPLAPGDVIDLGHGVQLHFEELP